LILQILEVGMRDRGNPGQVDHQEEDLARLGSHGADRDDFVAQQEHLLD
jgi:hypothetical protein